MKNSLNSAGGGEGGPKDGYKFDPTMQVAYCKYCYRVHDDWRIAEDHDAGHWSCFLCDHTSREDRMTIYNLTEV